MAEPRKYWNISAKGPKAGEVLIYEQIGAGFFEDGLGAAQFAKELKDLGDIDSLSVRINSPGGSVFEGQAIYSQLKNHKAQKTVYIDGLAASIASVIAMAGDKIVMPKNATMMIHDPWTMAIGNAEELRKQADSMDVVKKGIVAAYASKTKMKDKDIEDLMSEETWMTAEDAQGWGFVDEVEAEQKMAAMTHDLTKFKNVPQALMPPAVEPTQPKKENKKMATCKKHPGTELVAGTCTACDGEMQANAAVQAARKAEIERAKNIRAIGNDFDCKDLAEHAVENGWSEDTFRVELMNRKKKEQDQIGGPINLMNAKVNPAHEGKPFRSLGEQLKAVVASARGKHDPRLDQVWNAASGAGEAVPSDGGFLVQSDFTTSLLDRANETSVLYPLTKKIQVQGNGIEAPVIDETTRATGSRWGGVQVAWTNEGGTVTAKKPKFRKINMKLEKLMGLAYATEEVLADAGVIESIIGTAFAEEFGFVRDDSILNGTGAGQPLGILNAGCLVSIAKETGQTAATVLPENLIKMYASMPARNKQNAVWVINSEVMIQLMQMTMPIGTAGVPLFLPAGGFSQAPYGTIFGKRVIEVEQAQAVGTLGDVYFADFSEYLMIEKGGLNAARSLEIRFLYDEQTFRWTYRCNGQPIPNSATTPYKGSLSFSPFIGIAVRA